MSKFGDALWMQYVVGCAGEVNELFMNDCMSASFENVKVGVVWSVTKTLLMFVWIGLNKFNPLLFNFGVQTEGCPEQL